MIYLLFLLLSDPPQPRVAYLNPYPIVNEDDPRTFFRNIRQIEIDSDLLYLRVFGQEHLLVFDQNRNYLYDIGSKGAGPGEFPESVYSFGVSGGEVFALKSLTKVLHFQGNEFLDSFEIKGTNMNMYSRASNTFALDHNAVVIPAHPATRKLAMAYDYQGNILASLGEIFPINPEILSKNSATNDTLWVYGGNHWYGILKYHPLILKFNERWEQVAEFTFQDPLVDAWLEQWDNFQPKNSYNFPSELVTDLKYHAGSLFLICNGGLLQLNPDSGTHLRTWHFLGKGEGFENVQGKRLHIPHIAFFSDGKPVLSSGNDLWGHFLYTTDLALAQEGIQ